MSTFSLIRLDRGPKKGQVHIIPNCRKGGYRMVNGRETSRPQLRAQLLLTGSTYWSCYWYARGLLQGEAKGEEGPYVSAGNAPHWNDLIDRNSPSYEDE